MGKLKKMVALVLSTAMVSAGAAAIFSGCDSKITSNNDDYVYPDHPEYNGMSLEEIEEKLKRESIALIEEAIGGNVSITSTSSTVPEANFEYNFNVAEDSVRRVVNGKEEFFSTEEGTPYIFYVNDEDQCYHKNYYEGEDYHSFQEEFNQFFQNIVENLDFDEETLELTAYSDVLKTGFVITYNNLGTLRYINFIGADRTIVADDIGRDNVRLPFAYVDDTFINQCMCENGKWDFASCAIAIQEWFEEHPDYMKINRNLDVQMVKVTRIGLNDENSIYFFAFMSGNDGSYEVRFRLENGIWERLQEAHGEEPTFFKTDFYEAMKGYLTPFAYFFANTCEYSSLNSNSQQKDEFNALTQRLFERVSTEKGIDLNAEDIVFSYKGPSSGNEDSDTYYWNQVYFMNVDGDLKKILISVCSYGDNPVENMIDGTNQWKITNIYEEDILDQNINLFEEANVANVTKVEEVKSL